MAPNGSATTERIGWSPRRYTLRKSSQQSQRGGSWRGEFFGIHARQPNRQKVAGMRSFDQLLGLLSNIPDPRRAEGKLYKLATCPAVLDPCCRRYRRQFLPLHRDLHQKCTAAD